MGNTVGKGPSGRLDVHTHNALHTCIRRNETEAGIDGLNEPIKIETPKRKCDVMFFTEVTLSILQLPWLAFDAIVSHGWFTKKRVSPLIKIGNENATCSNIPLEFTEIWPPMDILETENEDYHKSLIPVWNFAIDGCAGCKQNIVSEISEICMKNYCIRLDVVRKYLDLSMCAMQNNDNSNYLHLAILHESEEVAITLLDILGTKNAMTTMTSQYEGVTTVHLAIACKMKRYTDRLFSVLEQDDLKALLNSRAIGDTFTSMYPFGECLLHFAVHMGDVGMVRTLKSLGGDVMQTDSRGNTAMHVLAHTSESKNDICRELFALLLMDLSTDEPFRMDLLVVRALIFTKNNEGFTALQIAASLGNRVLMEELFNLLGVYRFPIEDGFAHGVACYDVSEVDPALVDGSSTVSLLETIVMSNDEKAMECLNIPPIKQLIKIRWNHTRPYMLLFCLFYIWLLIWLTEVGIRDVNGISTFKKCLRNNGTNCTATAVCQKNAGGENIAIGLLSILILFFSLMEAVKIYQAAYRLRLNTFRVTAIAVVARFDFGFNISFIAYFVLKLLCVQWRPVAISLSLMYGWMMLMTYTRAFKVLSLFNIMYRKLLRRDIILFYVLFLLLLSAFTSACRMLFKNPPIEFQDPIRSLLTFMKLAMGLTDFDALLHSDYPSVSAIYFIMFITLANTLLFNMLIATMTTTFTSASQDTLCIHQRASELMTSEWSGPKWMHRIVFKNVQHKILKFGLAMEDLQAKNIYLLQCQEIKRIN